MDTDMHGDSDNELIGGTRAMRNRRSVRLGNSRRILARNDDLPEEVDNTSDQEDFEENKSGDDDNSEGHS